MKELLKRITPYLLFALVVPFALYSNLRIIHKEAHRLNNSWHSDEMDYEACLAPLRELIPEGAVVGYVTDEGVDPLEKGKYLRLTQYVLSPLLVAEGEDHPFVVANNYTVDDGKQEKGTGLVPVKDSCGLRLYRGAGR